MHNSSAGLLKALGPMWLREQLCVVLIILCVFSRCWDAEKQFDSGDDKKNYAENKLLRPVGSVHWPITSSLRIFKLRLGIINTIEVIYE